MVAITTKVWYGKVYGYLKLASLQSKSLVTYTIEHSFFTLIAILYRTEHQL